MLIVETIAKIRRYHFVDGRNIKKISRLLRLSRNTVRKVAVAVCYGLLPLCRSTGLFFVLAAVSGLGWGIAMPLQSAAMFDISASTDRAMNQNLLLVMMQGGFFLGPFLGGQLISLCGHTALFLSLAVSGGIAGLLRVAIQQPVSGKSL